MFMMSISRILVGSEGWSLRTMGAARKVCTGHGCWGSWRVPPCGPMLEEASRKDPRKERSSEFHWLNLWRLWCLERLLDLHGMSTEAGCHFLTKVLMRLRSLPGCKGGSLHGTHRHPAFRIGKSDCIRLPSFVFSRLDDQIQQATTQQVFESILGTFISENSGRARFGR